MENLSQLTLENEIKELSLKLTKHPLYPSVNSLISLRLFMQVHVYAVWDFMSLLKRLQQEITCISIPWRPSRFPKKMVRLINEIVLGEESDQDDKGNASDHFSLYLDAMSEVGANIKPILSTIDSLDISQLPGPIRKFVDFNFDMALNGELHQVAGVFFFGREKLIPDMFSGLLADLMNNNNESTFPQLKYYLERHIHLDGEEHSQLAYEMLNTLCEQDSQKVQEALHAGIKSLQLRSELWDYTLQLIKQSANQHRFVDAETV